MATVSGGDGLEKALNELAAKIGKGGALNVGFLEGATYPDGTSVAMVAAIQDGGAPSRGIPPRPFFRNMVKEKSGAWPEQLAGLLEANDFDVAKALALMGEGIKGQLQQSIIDTNDPALSQLTLLARKWKADNPDGKITGTIIGQLARRLTRGGVDVSGVSIKPLIESGTMLNAVDYEVKT